ncbi:MAG TPA: hypothetical protein VF433_01150 [Cellvibrio sp.]
MNQKIIAQPLGLIDPSRLNVDERYLFSVNYEMFTDKNVKVYKKGNYLVVHTVYWSKINKEWRSDQEEFPLEALGWIVDRFENGFFKPQDQGGASDFERSLRKEFNGELIGINAMAHCCAENLPGFNIWNANRASYISEIPPQQWDIPRYMLLEQGLLERLKEIALKYQAGIL